ncbi:dynactin 4 [Cryptococcus wingfieldii CBS 7118]|uniref:Dynactin subunit 4 n=1 Tax=Cryptococcus wingfieldii CBS 7118 TaxID=1295528 RepID=A0A1E3JZD6_9TREE|nr:dynactin 4 [Cryptococcus wingfieldii CBS 7118]ODO06171.1 dynactin 4 [Cryptococcus wingfieldii CBS 7118]
MSILYSCTHLDPPSQPLPPSYPSSHPSFSPLEKLYFCEECDAIRCDLCVGVEVASFFCPNCLFDVPGANVRGDKNRQVCARSCFSCPQCTSSLAIQASDLAPGQEVAEGANAAAGAPYLLVCPGCKWSSKEVGWEFEKPTGIALQLQKIHTQTEKVQSEFDSIKDHLESYITTSNPPTPQRTRVPSRHISHLTQMAAKALHRPVPGMAGKKRAGPGLGGEEKGKEKVGWDELGEYKAKGSWRDLGLEKGLEAGEFMAGLEHGGWEGVAELEKRWDKSWESDRMAKATLPQRIPLKTKLTKRCPDPNCRHLLIQPDTKGIRMKIKMVAANYLPVIEIGRRRRRVQSGDLEEPSGSTLSASGEDAERRRKERRRRTILPNGMKEEEEPLSSPLRPSQTYTFQLALTNPLYDPIQIRLTQPAFPRHAPTPNHQMSVLTPHFTINALKDAWAYDEDEVDEEADGSEDAMSFTTGTGTGTGTGTHSTLGKKRMSVLGASMRDKRHNKELGVEKKGNISKVTVEVETLAEADGPVEFDLEVRYTYRAEGEGTPIENEGGRREERIKEEYKTFTFWVRVHVGDVEV